MTDRRWESLTGIVGVGLTTAALVLPGPPPKASDSAASMQAMLVQHRGAFVGGLLVASLGLTALLWFIGVVAAMVRRHDSADSASSTVALAGGLAGVLLMFVGMVVFSGAAFRVAGLGNQVVVRAFVDTGNILMETSKFGLAVLIFATCQAGAMSGCLPKRAVAAGRASGAPLVLSAFPSFLTDHGVGQSDGPIDLAGTVPAFVWLAALSVVLARAESTERLSVGRAATV